MSNTVYYTRALSTAPSTSLRYVLLNDNTAQVVVTWMGAKTTYVYKFDDLARFEQGYNSAKSKGNFVSRITSALHSDRVLLDPDLVQVVRNVPVAKVKGQVWEAEVKVARLDNATFSVLVKTSEGENILDAVRDEISGVFADGAYELVGLSLT